MTAKYEQKLIEEKNRLVAELGKIGRRDGETGEWQVQSSDVSETKADENDNADRFEDHEEKSSLMVPLEKRLNEVERALTKILDGGFGICVVCGNGIEAERLEANPAAETCMAHLQ